MPDRTVKNSGTLYVNGLQSQTPSGETSTQLIEINPGAARDSLNVNDIVSNEIITVNIDLSGANGLDDGTIAANEMYALYLIGDSTKYATTSALISLDFVTPNVPGGYDMYRRIGAIFTIAGVDIAPFRSVGDGCTRKVYYELSSLLRILDGGGVTTPTELSLLKFVPPLPLRAYLVVSHIPVGANSALNIEPFGANGVGATIFGASNFGNQVAYTSKFYPYDVDGGVPKFRYFNSNGGSLSSIDVHGFEDEL